MSSLAFGHERVLRGTRYECLDCGAYLGDIRVAANFRKLRREPWAQTPENRAAIEMAERRYPHDTRVTPWMLREFRKGRLVVAPPWLEDVRGLMQAEQGGDEATVKYYSDRLESDRPDIVFFQNEEGHDPMNGPPLDEDGNPIQPEPFQPGAVQGIIKMLDHAQQRQSPIDIMGSTIEQIMPQYEHYKNEVVRDPNAGEIVHSFPNDWTIRKVNEKGHIFDEGEEMRNCVPKYVNQIAQGTHHLFSLRDNENVPKANVLIVPKNQGGHWDGGTVVDIREGANRQPRPSQWNPEPDHNYKDYIRNWFATFETPPKAHFNPGPPGDQGAGDPRDYGIEDFRYAKLRYAKLHNADTHSELVWTPVEPEREPWIFEADRLDLLRNPEHRPDLQTEDGLKFIRHIEDHHSPTNDILMPFLAKEWKAGRAYPGPNGVHFLSKDHDPVGVAEQLKATVNALTAQGYGGSIATAIALTRTLGHANSYDRDRLDTLGEFLRSNHPSKRGLDLNKRDTTIHDVEERHDKYKEWKKKREDREDTVFKHGDGSFIKKLRKEDCEEEGTAMNNCIRDPYQEYGEMIDAKTRLLYSIRDKNGEPHIDVEIEPQHYFNKKTGESLTKREYDMHAYERAMDRENTLVENLDDYEPMPQGGKVRQIQGKNNRPPDPKYAPLVKEWFSSHHFHPSGEDMRPTWGLEKTHFQRIGELWTPENLDPVFYHPGDYGMEDPGVTTDYHGMVRSIPDAHYYDPEGKWQSHLVDWARRHGELDDLRDAVHHPDTEEALIDQMSTPGQVGDHPDFQRWMAENPQPVYDEPVPEVPVCPDCKSAIYNGGLCACPEREYPHNPRTREIYEQERHNWSAGERDHRNNVVIPWTNERNQMRRNVAHSINRERYYGHPYQESLENLQGTIEQARNGQLTTPVYAHFAPRWSYIVTANLFNRLRNQLKKSDSLDEKNELAIKVLEHAYPNHDKHAEWLHREFRKGRLRHTLATHQDTIDSQLQNAERYEQQAKEQAELNGEDHYTVRDYENYAQQAREMAANYQKIIEDPDQLAKAQFEHYDENTYATEPIESDWLKELQAVLQKRKQKRTDEDGNPLKTNLMEMEYGDIAPEVKESLLAKRARKAGEMIHAFPDKWSIKRLQNAAEAKLESDCLGHCIHQYGDKIERGESHNYSLRDPKGLPHVTLEIKHKRDPHVNWNSFRDIVGDSEFKCPMDGGKVVHGKCTTCAFNIDQMEEWHGTKPEDQEEYVKKLREKYDEEHGEEEGKPKQYPEGDPRNDECPNCGSRAKEKYGDDWFCMSCSNTYDMSAPFDNDTMNEGGQAYPQFYREERRGVPTPHAVQPENWFKEVKPDLQDAGLIKYNHLGGAAYQIQGKENVAPHPKYHRYIQEWMRSIPYEDRPTATWSSYFTPTDVLHVDDLHLGGKKGEDDFGFAMPGRGYDWDSILHSLHGSPKEWDTGGGGYEKKFKRGDKEGTDDKQYLPDHGRYLYEFAKDKGHLPELMEQVGKWGPPDNIPVPTVPATEKCVHCGRPGFLHRNWKDPNTLVCSYCQESSEASQYQTIPEPPAGKPTYNAYQAAAVQHLGPLLAQHPELSKDKYFPDPTGFSVQGGSYRCPSCAREVTKSELAPYADQVNYPGYQACPHCNAAYTQDRWDRARMAKVASVEPVPHEGYHGQVCHCLWNDQVKVDGLPIKRSQVQKLADKFNDFLMNPKARPDLQTPEAQSFLQTLQGRYLNEKTDPLMPWIVREWKKGRVTHQPPLEDERFPAGQVNPGTVQYEGPEDRGVERADGSWSTVHALRPDDFNHWGDWYASNHPTRQGVDIMSLQTPHVVDKIREWDTDMRSQAEGAAEMKGVHEFGYPDGWSIQRLNSEAQLKDEGEKMGHCVGSYWPHVRDGRDLIYSLRDHHNEPHATWEIKPGEMGQICNNCGEPNHRNNGPKCAECHGDLTPRPHGGKVVQIQGKGNEPPIEDYQQRIKEYFSTFAPEDLPTWEDQYIEDLDELDDDYGYTQYHEGDYGLNKPNMEFDWPTMVRNHVEGGSSSYGDPTDAAYKALDHDDLNSLSDAVDEIDWRSRDDFMENLRHDFEQDPEAWMEAYGMGEFDEDEPDPEDFEAEPEEGYDAEFDQEAYDDAVRDYEERKKKWQEDHYEDAADYAWGDSDEYGFISEWENAVWAARRSEADRANPNRGITARKKPRKPTNRKARARKHPHHTMGHDCYCTFNRQEPEPREPAMDIVGSPVVAKVILCDTCGNELEGAHCPQCDWGGYSNAMDPHQNPRDPVKDLKSPVQSSLWEMVIPADRWKF